jgi:acetolactate synthase regulatory subunit
MKIIFRRSSERKSFKLLNNQVTKLVNVVTVLVSPKGYLNVTISY